MSVPEPPVVTLFEVVPDVVAARGQLETAIWLWFHQFDHSSVHTLAVAVQGLLTSVAGDKKQPPPRYVQAMRERPDSEQDKLRRPQNFFKHGDYKGRKENAPVLHIPESTEIIMADDAATFHRLFGFSTPLFDLYLLRYEFAFPQSKVSMGALKVKLAERIKIDEIKGLADREFFDVVLPHVIAVSETP